MQIKYGTRASSGGGRSSARETIGRVAAGAIAEKWLASEFGTRIVTFVSSVGTVALPRGSVYKPDGSPWTRAEVDTIGTLTLLRDPATGWKAGPLPGKDADKGEIAAAKAAQDALDAADEAAFIAVYNRSSRDYAAQMELAEGIDSGSGVSGTTGAAASPDASHYSAGVPCYETHDGALLDMHGQPAVPGPSYDVAAARTNEIFTLRCPHAPTSARMASLIRSVKGAQDSTGGVLTTVCSRVPIGLGEPVFDKAEALLAHAMLSLPATKGFEIGSGFDGAKLRGSVHNDAFVSAGAGAPSSSASSGTSLLATTSNHAGGTLGGITNGSDIVFRVPIKPVSTIGRAQVRRAGMAGRLAALHRTTRSCPTTTRICPIRRRYFPFPSQVTASYTGEESVLEAKGRHDPCVLPRASPLVEAMAALVLADLALIQRARSGGPLHVLPERDEGPGGASGSAGAGAQPASATAAEDAGALSSQKRKQPEA